MRAGASSESSEGAAPPPRPDVTTVLTYASLLVIAAAAWVHVLWSGFAADDMAGMDMAMAPTLHDGLVYVAAWTVMMTAMMLPSASPMIALYAVTERQATRPLGTTVAVAQFTLVYLVVWALTGIPVYFASVLVPFESLTWGIGVVLIVAGVFQLSPLKHLCLRHCRSPLGFLLGHWRPGWRGRLAMARDHALYCLGCCWALMIVLVVAGAMGLPWVLLIAAVVAAEKLAPRGERIAWVTGVLLVVLGVAVAFRSDLAAMLRVGGHSM